MYVRVYVCIRFVCLNADSVQLYVRDGCQNCCLGCLKALRVWRKCSCSLLSPGLVKICVCSLCAKCYGVCIIRNRIQPSATCCGKYQTLRDVHIDVACLDSNLITSRLLYVYNGARWRGYKVIYTHTHLQTEIYTHSLSEYY